jgi:hypothetical protein
MNSSEKRSTNSSGTIYDWRWAPHYTFNDNTGRLREVGAVYADKVDRNVAHDGLEFLIVDAGAPDGAVLCPRCGQMFVAVADFSAEHCRDVHYYGQCPDILPVCLAYVPCETIQ